MGFKFISEEQAEKGLAELCFGEDIPIIDKEENVLKFDVPLYLEIAEQKRLPPPNFNISCEYVVSSIIPDIARIETAFNEPRSEIWLKKKVKKVQELQGICVAHTSYNTPFLKINTLEDTLVWLHSFSENICKEITTPPVRLKKMPVIRKKDDNLEIINESLKEMFGYNYLGLVVKGSYLVFDGDIVTTNKDVSDVDVFAVLKNVGRDEIRILQRDVPNIKTEIPFDLYIVSENVFKKYHVFMPLESVLAKTASYDSRFVMPVANSKQVNSRAGILAFADLYSSFFIKRPKNIVAQIEIEGEIPEGLWRAIYKTPERIRGHLQVLPNFKQWCPNCSPCFTKEEILNTDLKSPEKVIEALCKMRLATYYNFVKPFPYK